MFVFELIDINSAGLVRRFPQHLLNHGFSTHSDAAMNLPPRNHNPSGKQNLRPCVYVLVIAVNQGAVQSNKTAGNWKFEVLADESAWRRGCFFGIVGLSASLLLETSALVAG